MESYGGPLHGISKGIYFTRHDEVVRVQALDLFCVQDDGAKAPPERDHGVVPFGISQPRHHFHKLKRRPEVTECECLLDLCAIGSKFPTWRFGEEPRRLLPRQRRNPAPAGLANLRIQDSRITFHQAISEQMLELTKPARFQPGYPMLLSTPVTHRKSNTF